MIPLDHRQRLVRDIDQAHREGARLRPACEVAGIDVRTLQRWRSTGLALQEDQRKHCQRPTPAHALTQEERQEILRVANEPRFADMPPSRIVPMLADEGRYIASESSFARVLRAHGQTDRKHHAKNTSSGINDATTILTCTEYPARGFCDLASARQWAAEFVHWYNHEHRHSGIQFVTPQQRHTGQDKAILAHHHQVYEQAKQNRPA